MTKARTNADNVTADIAGITAGTGITGGGTSGTVTVTNSMATAIDAAGDLIYGTGSDAFTRLAIGSTDQILKVTDGVPAWATPAVAASGANFSLLGTNNPASTTTSSFTGISGKNELFLTFTNVQLTSTGTITFRINADSGSNYLSNGFIIPGTGAPAVFTPRGGGTHMGNLEGTSGDYSNGYVKISGCNTTGPKPYQLVWFDYDGSIYSAYSAGGIWNNESTVTSFDVTSTTNFGSAGNTTIKLYGSAG